jgi:hypothetical protein
MVRSKGEEIGAAAMRQILYFRLGESDQITFGSLVSLLSNIRHLLQDFDAALSKDPRGSVLWQVEVLEKSSPIILGLSGEVVRRRNAPVSSPWNLTGRIGQEVLRSTAQISNSAQRPSIVSDSAISHYRNLAVSSKKIGDISVYDDNTNVVINETTLQNIDKLTGPKTKSVGSILGKLEAISVHKSNEIRVWDENTGRPVRCKYPRALEEMITASLRARVLVAGLVSYNANGQAISVDASEIKRYPSPDELPGIDDVIGCVDDVTGGASLRDYLSHIRDE